MFGNLNPLMKWLMPVIVIGGIAVIFFIRGEGNQPRPDSDILHGVSQPAVQNIQPETPLRPADSEDHFASSTHQTPPDPVPSIPEGEQKGFLEIGKIAGTLKLAGGDLLQGQRIPPDHTCYRDNLSPAVAWSGAPPETKSIVLLFEKAGQKPEAEIYWGIYNIPSAISAVPRSLPIAPILPDGLLHLKNDFGHPGYTGPCIPRGRHPFRLRIFALDLEPSLQAGMNKEQLFGLMNGHILDVATVDVEHYHRF